MDNLKSRSFSQVSSIKTLNTILPHAKLKIRLKETIHKAFSHRNYGSKCFVPGYNSPYFSSKIQKGKTCYSEEQVISMLEFLIDNIFVMKRGKTLNSFLVFKFTISIYRYVHHTFTVSFYNKLVRKRTYFILNNVLLWYHINIL